MTPNKLSIFYIGEDENLIAALRAENFIVDYKSNGVAALKHLTNGCFALFGDDRTPAAVENSSYDALLCETRLRDCTGFDLFRELGRNGMPEALPFILVADAFCYSLRDSARELKIDDLYDKPLDPANLRIRLDFLTRHKHKAHPARSVMPSEPDFYRTPFPKRLFDLFCASAALAALSPVFVVILAAIRLDSKGPFFYSAKRVGANFKTFTFYKFRTMYVDADKRIKEVEHLNQYQSKEIELNCSHCAALPPGQFCSPVVYYDHERTCERLAIMRKNNKQAFLKIPNDPRITRIGRFLRNTSIDELPQLFNILKGDMSVVGNRPLPVQEANSITRSIYARRFSAAAGLTGLWQVELRGRGGIISEEERFRLDNAYAENNSFRKDIKLILRTLPVLIQKENV